MDGERVAKSKPWPDSPRALSGWLRHKAGIVELLRPGRDGWSAEGWRAFYDEWAGIAEFDGGLLRHRMATEMSYARLQAGVSVSVGELYT